MGPIGKRKQNSLATELKHGTPSIALLCAVAHNGNFTRAAKAENVAQPSLSQQILKLEAELGAKLFDRFPRSARLIQFGRTLLFRAEAILQTGRRSKNGNSGDGGCGKRKSSHWSDSDHRAVFSAASAYRFHVTATAIVDYHDR
jgi:DNA-binding transcriptional LysR family regulator